MGAMRERLCCDVVVSSCRLVHLVARQLTRSITQATKEKLHHRSPLSCKGNGGEKARGEMEAPTVIQTWLFLR